MPDISLRILIGATAAVTYKALTTEKGLSGWWTPGVTTSSLENSIARFPFEPSYFKEMRISSLILNQKVAWECIAGASEWVSTKISFKLEEGNGESLLQSFPELSDQFHQLSSGQATILSFQHSDWRDQTPMFAECSYTWALFLRSLKFYCETGQGRPWPFQHRSID